MSPTTVVMTLIFYNGLQKIPSYSMRTLQKKPYGLDFVFLTTEVNTGIH